MKKKIHQSFGFLITFDSTCYHVRVRVPYVQREYVKNQLPRWFVALSSGTLFSELSHSDTMHFCFSIKDLNNQLPYGTSPAQWLYNHFVDALFHGMVDYVCPPVY